MTPLEAAALCRFTKAVCPQQAIDEYTPDAWHPLLGDIDFNAAKEAVVALGRKQVFIAPAEIRTEVRLVRERRLIEFGPLPNPPAELTDTEQAEWRRDLIRRIGDGEDIAPVVELEPSPEHVARLAELTRGAFQEVPGE